jgi:hypothetical protein
MLIIFIYSALIFVNFSLGMNLAGAPAHTVLIANCLVICPASWPSPVPSVPGSRHPGLSSIENTGAPSY